MNLSLNRFRERSALFHYICDKWLTQRPTHHQHRRQRVLLGVGRHHIAEGLAAADLGGLFEVQLADRRIDGELQIAVG